MILETTQRTNKPRFNVQIFDMNDQAQIEVDHGWFRLRTVPGTPNIPTRLPAIPGTQNIVPGAVVLFQNITWYPSVEKFVTRQGASSVQVILKRNMKSCLWFSNLYGLL
jgi:hypothetical protein